jgi:hypothetical protein
MSRGGLPWGMDALYRGRAVGRLSSAGAVRASVARQASLAAACPRWRERRTYAAGPHPVDCVSWCCDVQDLVAPRVARTISDAASDGRGIGEAGRSRPPSSTDGADRHYDGGHVGLQWHRPHPGSRAVNWDGYVPDGRRRLGLAPASATGHPNTRDLWWDPGQSYTLTVERAAEGAGPELSAACAVLVLPDDVVNRAFDHQGIRVLKLPLGVRPNEVDAPHHFKPSPQRQGQRPPLCQQRASMPPRGRAVRRPWVLDLPTGGAAGGIDLRGEPSASRNGSAPSGGRAGRRGWAGSWGLPLR